MRSDEIVPPRVPDEPTVLDHVVEDGGDVGGIDGGGQADPCAAAPAVEVGGDEELGVRQRIVDAEPRHRPGPQLELARSPSRRQPVGEPGEEQPPGRVGVDGGEIEAGADSAGRDRPPARRGVEPRRGRRVRRRRGPATMATRRPRSAGNSSLRPRRTSRSSTTAATTHAVVDGVGGDDAGQARVQRQVDHPATEGGERPVVGDRSEVAQQLQRFLPRPLWRRVRERQLLDRRAPRRDLEGEAGQVDRGHLGSAVRRPAAVFDPRPQPVGDPRLGAPGAAGALVGRVAADRHRRSVGSCPSRHRIGERGRARCRRRHARRRP